MKFNPYPEIATERLVLSKIEESDTDVIFFLRSDETVNKYIERPENRKTKTKNDALEFIQKITLEAEEDKSITWGMKLRGNNELIGTICLWSFSEDGKVAELGYGMAPDYFGKGYMTEALVEVLDYGFQKLNFEMIEAFTHKGNSASKNLLERNGFQFAPNRKDDDNEFNTIFEIKNPNI